MKELEEPIGDIDVGDRRRFCRQVLKISERFIDLMVQQACEAAGDKSDKYWDSVKTAVAGAMQSYAFYRSGAQTGNADCERPAVEAKLRIVEDKTKQAPKTVDSVIGAVDGAIDAVLKSKGISHKAKGKGWSIQ